MLSLCKSVKVSSILSRHSTQIVNKDVLAKTIELCRKRNVIIPTYEQMFNPKLVPKGIVNELKSIGLWDVNPRNLFRITWKNEPKEFGGGFGETNYLEIPKEISGIDAKIVVLVGKYFPTGSHKVGATFGPLVEKMVRGSFDPTNQKALWPSTGNYCRGGAFNSSLLGCKAIAVLPEGMSQERFDWLNSIGSEIYGTPGTESNVKEVFDKTHALKAEMGDNLVVLNQFAEFGNPMWHYAVTARTIEELYNNIKGPKSRLSGLFLTQGSGGTLGCSMYLHQKYPNMKTGCGEALQCPTLLENGYGAHRIEGIGDKHVPWILNMRDMNAVIGVDDQDCVDLLRLFNEKDGKDVLLKKGVDRETIEKLSLFGISSIANLLGSIKLAKYYEMDKDDVVFSIATDSAGMYQSRLKEMNQESGKYSNTLAHVHFNTGLMKQNVSNVLELTHVGKRRCHQLKYYTWVEQQGKTVEELDRQWYDNEYWTEKLDQYKVWDNLINEFNEKAGIINKY
eukprot:Anaeramoba_flamelloidesa433_1248.p1 GENE.a433_1248~~a433_1248.p1  ORF type:complete len:507 (-),score=112.98 a433_1248:133-1653(-)